MTKGKTIEQAKKDMREKAKKALEEGLLMIEADAKLMCPVDTGTLRRSITHDVKEEDDKIVGEVGTNVEYAYFAELKKPYLEPAVDQNLESIRRKIKEVLSSD
ncbi:HK97 gp10 family phage protein [Brassicibacter mesophilus]|uniref:HK97 gp10 family phage protein n=1 Tax=Brassicibacter mesophilus TaxID=745119 RepID=UPI003D1C0BB1